MIEQSVSFQLPLPWTDGHFSTDKIGEINFLVGPNGSGKTQFAVALQRVLPNTRLLGTDRLSGMTQYKAFGRFLHDAFASGLPKNQFNHLIEAGKEGAGIDAFIILENKFDIRIRIEATLSHLFDRDVVLDWDSGNLVPRIKHKRHGVSYRLDRDECHGIRELLILLTHLYDDDSKHLIIDEPELNLHPQYQAFFMQEVRKAAQPENDNEIGKIVFLISHSLFVLDFRTEDDVKSVISFTLQHSIPVQIAQLNLDSLKQPLSVVRRLNAHHKQFFFSDNPVFVEGFHDTQVLEALLSTRGVSLASAGSCIIDVGGRDELSYYLKLCKGLGKSAHFVYDLDSLFNGTLRSCIGEDNKVKGFLIDAGCGDNFVRYCGELDRKLTSLIDDIMSSDRPESLDSLVEYFHSLGNKSSWEREQRGKARTAALIAVGLHRDEMENKWSTRISDVEGRLNKVVEILGQVRVKLLTKGALEAYLPSYTGNPYRVSDEAKRSAVKEEIERMQRGMDEEEPARRYGELYDVCCSLPVKQRVDYEATLKKYMSRYIHEMQQAVVNNPGWLEDRMRQHLLEVEGGAERVFALKSFVRNGQEGFRATIEVSSTFGGQTGEVDIDENTNAGMARFAIAWRE